MESTTSWISGGCRASIACSARPASRIAAEAPDRSRRICSAAPEQILATNTSGGAVTRSRPLCPYPQTAIYNGTGSTDDAANFHCGGNLEKRRIVCADVLTKYKHEANGRLDFSGTGLDRDDCSPRRGHGHDDDDDDRHHHHHHGHD